MTKHLPAFAGIGALTLSPAGATSQAIYVVNFPDRETQQKDNWCWAAITLACLKTWGGPPAAESQSEIVQQVFGNQNDDGADLYGVLRHFNLRKEDMEPVYDPNGATDENAKLIRTEVAGGRPVPIHIAWKEKSNTLGHEICVFGVQGGGFWIYDPSGKDHDDDNAKLISVAGLSNYDSGLAKETVGYWSRLYLISRP